MPIKSPKSGRTNVVAIIAGAVGLAIVAFGGIALASVTTGGSPGFDTFSAGSAVQPPPPPPAPTPAPTPTPIPVPDTTPPSLIGAKGTKVVSSTKRAMFRFGANETATFVCKVDSRAFRPCTSPFQTPKLSPGHHFFYVQAIDAAGNRSVVTKIGFSVEKPPAHKKNHG